MTDQGQKLAAAKARIGAVAKAAPDAFDGFSRLAKAATRDGRVQRRAEGTDRQPPSPSPRAARTASSIMSTAPGGTARRRADLVEVLQVAVEMGGGPALMYAGGGGGGGKALEALSRPVTTGAPATTTTGRTTWPIS